MNAVELAAIPDYTDETFGAVWVVVAADRADHPLVPGQVEGAHPHIEARFSREADADRFAKHARRTMTWKTHRVVEVNR